MLREDGALSYSVLDLLISLDRFCSFWFYFCYSMSPLLTLLPCFITLDGLLGMNGHLQLEHPLNLCDCGLQ